jgi:hypothetical protein
MNKYWMLSAAAVLAGTATATASGCYTIGFGSQNGGSFCDHARVYTGVDAGALSGAVRAWSHTDCSGQTSEGQGLLARIPGLGKASQMSDNFYSKNYGCNYLQLGYTLPKKIRDGQPWTLWIGEYGFTAFEANAGTLANVNRCKDGAGMKSHGTTSTLSLVKQLVAARRNAHRS